MFKNHQPRQLWQIKTQQKAVSPELIAEVEIKTEETKLAEAQLLDHIKNF